MGEQKRKHIAEIIAKATLCGAVIRTSSGGFFHRELKMPVGSEVYFWARLPEGVTWSFSKYKDMRWVHGETEYQCAVNFLQALGVPYETLTYENKGLGIRATTRLRQRARKRSGVSRKPKSARTKPR